VSSAVVSNLICWWSL